MGCGLCGGDDDRQKVTLLKGSGTFKHLLREGNLCEAKFDSEVGESDPAVRHAWALSRGAHTGAHTEDTHAVLRLAYDPD